MAFQSRSLSPRGATPERLEGIRRRQNIAFKLADPPTKRPLSIEERALRAEEIRVEAMQRARTPPPIRPPSPTNTDPSNRFEVASLPNGSSLPPRLRLGWQRDSEAYGWFGGTAAQVDYIEAQQAKIAGLQQELKKQQLATHWAHAQRTIRQPSPRPSSPRPSSPRPASPTPRAEVATASSAAREAATASTTPRDSTSNTNNTTPRSTPPATTTITSSSPLKATADAMADTTPSNDDLAAATASLQAMHKKLNSMSSQLAQEQTRRREAEEALVRERREWAALKGKLIADAEQSKKAAARSQADMMSIRRERDQLEWLLRRVTSPEAPRLLALCHSCGKNVGLEDVPDTPRSSSDSPRRMSSPRPRSPRLVA